MDLNEVLAEIFPSMTEDVWSRIQQHEGCCESCDHTIIVLLAYIAWKMEEMERRMPGGP
jgi:hypothetical protein